MMELKPGSHEFVEQYFGRRIDDDTLLLNALDASGYRGFTNRRLALLGDAVGKVAILENWYRETPTANGNDIVSNMMNNDRLATIGRGIGLAHFVLPGPGGSHLSVTNKTLATTVEALLGAVFIDSGNSTAAVLHAINLLNAAVPMTTQ